LATGLVILVPYAEKSRIDAPGVLHHIIASGIERRKIFQDYHDRNNFLDRLGGILTETPVMAVSYAVQRGEKIAREFNFSL
jgi:hypothetical protein